MGSQRLSLRRGALGLHQRWKNREVTTASDLLAEDDGGGLSTNTQPLVADYSEWSARDYFQTYYSDAVLPDEQAVLAYQIDVLSAAPSVFGRGLEYGCGPTMHRAIAASKYALRIDMADWLEDNLDEAREWLSADESASQWNRFTRYVLACEGHALPDDRTVLEREALTRNVVGGLYVSDARVRQPLGPTREAFFDFIITGFCIDAISSDRRVFRRCLGNITSMLLPGGTFIIHALHRCKAYKCGERMFPGANLGIDNMRDAMLEHGVAPSSIDVQVIPCPDNSPFGYSGILTASGRMGTVGRTTT